MHDSMFLIPMIRLNQGTYLIGTKKCKVLMKNSTCMVRIGGGFDLIGKYVKSIERREYDNLMKMIKSYKLQGKTFSDVFSDLIKKCGSDPKEFKKLEPQILKQLK